MLRRSLAVRAVRSGSTHAADVIVVGGGLTGCLVASRLAQDNISTLLIEEGCDMLKQSKWQRQMGCAALAHRFGQRGYESRYVTVPQRPLWPSEAPSSGEEGAASVHSSRSDDAVTTIPAPRLLGGSGIMGSRSWCFGDAGDWAGTPLDYRNDIAPRIQRLEGVVAPEPHRGKYGRFLVSRSVALSPYYKTFTAAMNAHVPLVSSFNKSGASIATGCGRPEVFVDANTRIAHQTLDAYVAQTLLLKRPLQVRCDTRVVGIAGNRQGTATGVRYVDEDGSVQTLESSVVVLAAGAIGSTKLAHGSQASLFGTATSEGSAASAIGAGFWDAPSVVMQFESKDQRSHNCFMSPLVQAVVYLQQLVGFAPPAVASSFDDLVAFWSSTGSQRPDIKFVMQPFTMDVNGSRGGIDHGFQIVVQLVRPASRGSVTASDVDPNYFADDADRVALQKGVAFIRRIVQDKTSGFQAIAANGGAPVAERFESRGVCGGGLCLGKAVSESSFLLEGTDNVYVCDSSLLPAPLIGDRTPPLLAIADKFADRYLNKLDVKARIDEDAPVSSNEARILY